MGIEEKNKLMYAALNSADNLVIRLTQELEYCEMDVLLEIAKLFFAKGDPDIESIEKWLEVE